MFEAEAEGLRELAAANAIRVPAVVDCGLDNGAAFIAIERLHFERATTAVEAVFGEQLANLHRHTKEQHGWHRDNTIGPTPQHNPWTDDWIDFFREYRLRFQLDLAARNGYTGELQSLGDRLERRLIVLVRRSTHGSIVLEELLPRFAHRCRVGTILLVHLFDEP